MSANDLILLILVAAGAFYAGYQLGRFKTLAELGANRPAGDGDEPLPGPRFDRLPADTPSRTRGSPPPATAGSGDGSWPDTGGQAGQALPRRSSKPPPAAAGLMGTGEAEKSGKRQK